MPRNGEHLGAAVIGLAQIEEPLTALAHDGRDRGQGFRVVDGAGFTVQPEVGGERRLVTRLALLPSNDSINAVSSPQMYAPAPSTA